MSEGGSRGGSRGENGGRSRGGSGGGVKGEVEGVWRGCGGDVKGEVEGDEEIGKKYTVNTTFCYISHGIRWPPRGSLATASFVILTSQL